MSAEATINPSWRTRDLPGSGRSVAGIEEFHNSIPGFRRTPLVSMPQVAGALGVQRVLVKHERERLGLPSFKIIGASWAVHSAIAARLDVTIPPRFAATVAAARSLPSGTTLSAATDGNHGRAVARMARLLGLRCQIYIPRTMSPARKALIETEGADVLVVNGSYDDAVRLSASEAQAEKCCLLVSDTSWPGYEAIPAAVADGYSTIFREASAQLAELTGGLVAFDLAVVPAGVGALTSAAVRNLAVSGSCDVVTVEPQGADCVRRSLAAGRPVVVPGPHDSIMAGLNCGEVSFIAWPLLRSGVRAAVAVADLEAMRAMRQLAAAGIAADATGAAGLAGLSVLAQDPVGAGLLGSRPDRTVLLLVTEGVTDPETYETVIAG